MIPVYFAHLDLLYLLWLIPLVVTLLTYTSRRRTSDLERFSRVAAALSSSADEQRWVKRVLQVLVLGFIVLATVGVGVAPHTVKIRRRGREVVFLVDVSRSMLAQDLAPNRLSRAKSEILGALPFLNGDRVALVAFAGSSSVICPLTFDYNFFAQSVKRVSPSSVSVGGSMIGDAIRATLHRVFLRSDHASKDLVLLSDGGDEGSYPVRAAAEAGKRGVRILSIGLGNEKSGTPIPVTGAGSAHKFLTYNHREVKTKLNSTLMRRIALATPGGRYLDVGTGSFDLGRVFRAFVSETAESNLGTHRVTQYQKLFQFFLLAALLALVGEMVVERRFVWRVRT